jgi:hypothetical protein
VLPPWVTDLLLTKEMTMRPSPHPNFLLTFNWAKSLRATTIVAMEYKVQLVTRN